MFIEFQKFYFWQIVEIVYAYLNAGEDSHAEILQICQITLDIPGSPIESQWGSRKYTAYIWYKYWVVLSNIANSNSDQFLKFEMLKIYKCWF